MSNKQAKRALQIIADNFSFFAALFEPEQSPMWAAKKQMFITKMPAELLDTLRSLFNHNKKSLEETDRTFLFKALCKPFAPQTDILNSATKFLLQHKNDPIFFEWYIDHEIENEGEKRLKPVTQSIIQLSQENIKQYKIKLISKIAESLNITTEENIQEQIAVPLSKRQSLLSNLDSTLLPTSKPYLALQRRENLYKEYCKLEDSLSEDLPNVIKIYNYRNQLNNFKKFAKSYEHTADSKDTNSFLEKALLVLNKIGYVFKQIGHAVTFGQISRAVKGSACFWKTGPEITAEKLEPSHLLIKATAA